MAEYSISSTERCRRWISSMNSTSPSCRSVSNAARSPARVRTGPAVMRNPAPISVATIPARDVLPSPGGPANRDVVHGLASLTRRLQHDRQMLDQFGLPEELRERPGPEPDFLGFFGTVRSGRIDDSFNRGRARTRSGLGFRVHGQHLPPGAGLIGSPRGQLAQRQPEHLFHPDIVA